MGGMRGALAHRLAARHRRFRGQEHRIRQPGRSHGEDRENNRDDVPAESSLHTLIMHLGTRGRTTVGHVTPAGPRPGPPRG